MYHLAPTPWSNPFTIDNSTGTIRYTGDSGQVINLSKHEKYDLVVEAKTEGYPRGPGCFDTTEPHIRSSTVNVTINVTDVNNNRPIFEECATYNSKGLAVREGYSTYYSFVRVNATDADKGMNAQVRYSLVDQDHLFKVHEIYGEVSSRKVIRCLEDHERKANVTVKATDLGEPPLEGFCTFEVNILRATYADPWYGCGLHRALQQVEKDAINVAKNLTRLWNGAE